MEDITNGRLDADSTCREYLDAPPEEQLELIRDLYVAEHGEENAGGQGNAVFQIDYSCQNSPDRRLGDIPI